MSLTCELYINGERVGAVYARRILADEMDLDGIHEYDCALSGAAAADVWRGRVTHRYDEGAWALVQRVVEAARAEGEGVSR